MLAPKKRNFKWSWQGSSTSRPRGACPGPKSEGVEDVAQEGQRVLFMRSSAEKCGTAPASCSESSKRSIESKSSAVVIAKVCPRSPSSATPTPESLHSSGAHFERSARADRLFATLDTTVRALHPETQPRILVSDTVGFIRNLPHDLVASFRSTLDEALDASFCST